MAKYNYSYKTDDKNIGKAVIRDAGISSKHAIEICSAIRKKSVHRAKTILEKIIKIEEPIKFTRFTEGAGHKKGKGSGKYPVKAATEVLKAIKSAESNAIDKGLSKDLKIVHLSAQRASAPWHYGRQRRRKMKRTHIEIVLTEETKRKDTKKEVKVETKTSPKPEEKTSTPKVENKQTESQQTKQEEIKK